MTASKCFSCVEVKPSANTHTKCNQCGHYRPLKANELSKVSKRAPK